MTQLGPTRSACASWSTRWRRSPILPLPPGTAACAGSRPQRSREDRPMPTDPTYLIVGASLCGAKAAETLRGEGFGGPVILLGSETERPYERPPLSKGYLLGKEDKSVIYVHEEGWYAEHGVDLRLGVTVTAVDPAGRTATTAAGEGVGYARLLLATGASPADHTRGRPGRRAVPADRRRLRAARGRLPGRRAGGHRRRGLDRPGDDGGGPRGRVRGDGGRAGADRAEPGDRHRAGRDVRR